MSEPNTGRYNEGFYADQVGGSGRAAAVVLPVVFAIAKPTRVIDIGCGQGAWLAAAATLGAQTLTGLDGAWVDRTKLRSPQIAFHATDLSQTIPDHGRHDLAISVEVAEHLPPSRAVGFVADLCRAADVVLFSAAVPLQGGTEHVNEERASAWVARFAAQEYDCFDLVRGAVWDDERVAWWYRQNIFVFVARRSPLHAAFASAPLPPLPHDLVHPVAFETKIDWLDAERERLTHWVEHPSIGQALRGLWRAFTRAFRGGTR